MYILKWIFKYLCCNEIIIDNVLKFVFYLFGVMGLMGCYAS